MAFTNEISFKDPAFISIQTQLGLLRENIEDRKTRLALKEIEQAEQLPLRQMFLEELQHVEQKLAPFREYGDFYISNALTSATTRAQSILIDVIESAERAIERLKDSIEDYEKQIPALLESLEKYPKDYDGVIRVTREEVKSQISFIPFINRRSLALGTNRTGSYIQWVYTDVQTTAAATNSAGKLDTDLTHALQDVVCRVYLGSNNITLAPRRGQRDSCVYRYGGSSRVHPHILSTDAPCLGDFGGTAMEALQARDYGTFALVILDFLRTTIASDIAGSSILRRHPTYNSGGIPGIISGKFGVDVFPDPEHPGFYIPGQATDSILTVSAA